MDAQPEEDAPKPSYEELLKIYEQPAIFLFPTAEGDVRFGTNIAGLSHHSAIALLHLGIAQLSAEAIGNAMHARAEKQANAERYTTKLIVPR